MLRPPWLAAPALTVAVFALVFTLVGSGPSGPASAAAAAALAEPTAVERAAPQPRGGPITVVERTAAPIDTPASTDTPAPTQTTAPEITAPPLPAPVAAAAPAVAPAQQSCPAWFFCYPRLGISGQIIPYNDCSGATDVGTSIRQLLCVRQGVWLAAHAYTAFGRITNFRVGDVVFVGGHRYEITGSSVQRACVPSSEPVAPLSLQTSLESVACGRVLVVQGR